MKILYGSMVFLMILGILLGIYGSSYNQFALNGATNTYATLSSFAITQVNTGYTNTEGLNPKAQPNAPNCDIFCQFWGDLVNGFFSFCNALGTPGCVLFGGTTPLAQLLSLGQNSSATLRNIQIANAVVNQQTQSSNIWFKELANPLDEAILIMGIFLGIGLLAGLFGAGLLARVVASVGIGLSVLVFIESQLGTFGTLPALIYIGFNGVVGILLLIIAWEAFNTPGAAT